MDGASAAASSSACSVALPRPASPLQPGSASFVHSEQCSADPRAFLGFYVPPRNDNASASRDGNQPAQKKRKLVLDVPSTTEVVTRGAGGFRPTRVNAFDALFAGSSQDDAMLEAVDTSNYMQTREHDQGKVDEESKSVHSPRARAQVVIDVEHSEKKEEQCAEDKIVSSLDSEDLAPWMFQTAVNAARLSVNGSSGCEKDTIVSVGRSEEQPRVSESCDRETKTGEDTAEWTQPLDADFGATRKGAERAQEEIEAYSGTGTLSYGTDSGCLEEEKTRNVEKHDSASRGSDEFSVVVTRVDETNDQWSSEDEVARCDGSQATQQEYLTPRVYPLHAHQVSVAERTSPSDVIVAFNENEQTRQNDDDSDECVATQPSDCQMDGEPLLEPDVSHRSDEVCARKHQSEGNCQAKASRSLEFSFLVPESHESEPRFSASDSSNGTPASRTDPPHPFESSISPVCLPTQADDAISSHVAVSTEENMSSLSSSPSKGKPNTTLQVDDASIHQTVTTPLSRNHKRHSSSPARNTSSNESHCGNALAPRPPVWSSTPKRRTRARTLTRVPSHRAYVSRSRTLFKYKFEFCLTGFMKTGEATLKELIEGHGGKIPERYQDVLYKTNLKAVVIATPVSWRKRKFMQALACGIPIVHPDWIKDCIESGCVVPFEGYQVPTGYSVTTRQFECLPPKQLQIFEGFSFGLASDVAQMSKTEAKDQANVMTFILKACGAKAVYANLSSKDTAHVDVVLCDEYTPVKHMLLQTCRYYKKRRQVVVKSFRWVTECLILQQLLDPKASEFEPLRAGCEDVCSASAEIGDIDKTTLKLYTGELVMADIAAAAADHYLLFTVCEILSIHLSDCNTDEGLPSKRKENNEKQVMLRVGMLRREPYNPELSSAPVKVLEISSSQVKRRVVAISKEQYMRLKYKDESIFYFEDEKERPKSSATG
ncbi:hypothetical protein PsorP6_009144 [Peronosclerospora sorghi]|uniref:Uncharacterized protein n=1 Tax=Peronosclerospora sorghi TaxID=230839 RepID=A0ACC0W073_9STRA|nr:hypothetical protein PsorP6_009144 [Peronosclerospora sorghi]